jgi:hypothetical protein
MKIREFLDQGDYSNYRNVRAAAVMFVALGTILMLGGLALSLMEPEPGHPAPPKALGVLVLLVGAAGAVGGVAVFKANPQWSKLVYVMACLYVLAFPIGTILSAVMFVGLGRYLNNVARFREAAARPPMRAAYGTRARY